MVIKHLDLDVNHFVIDLTKGEQKNPEYLKVNDLMILFQGQFLNFFFSQINEAGQVPAIDDDGFKLGESRAIATYLCNKYAPDSELYPKDPKKRAQVDRLLYFDAGTLYNTANAVMVSEIKLKIYIN